MTSEDYFNLRIDLGRALMKLRPKEANVLRLRHGLAGSAPHGTEDIARAYVVTRERIRQIECVAIRKLRHRHTDFCMEYAKKYGWGRHEF